VVFIGALASIAKEMNQALPWTRNLKDHRDIGQDWGLAELVEVRLHPGCERTPRSSSWPGISSKCVCVDIS
jgi:hypothetical protein